jgi:hypothetical protein
VRHLETGRNGGIREAEVWTNGSMERSLIAHLVSQVLSMEPRGRTAKGPLARHVSRVAPPAATPPPLHPRPLPLQPTQTLPIALAPSLFPSALCIYSWPSSLPPSRQCQNHACHLAGPRPGTSRPLAPPLASPQRHDCGWIERPKPTSVGSGACYKSDPATHAGPGHPVAPCMAVPTWLSATCGCGVTAEAGVVMFLVSTDSLGR